MITNSELRHRIDKAQGFLNGLSNQVSKQKLRTELEAEMEKFLANGGEIKQAQNQQFQVKHGTSDQYILINDLRTAIAKHDTAWMEKRFRIKKWYPIHEHHMCSDKRTDDTTDHVTDIRNHVSLSTKVVDL